MIIDNVNLNLLRIFECVFRTKSMTKAAEELHMTQSGVSQNIKNLEDILGVTLFDRIKQRPVPTHKANILFDACKRNLYDLDRALIEIKDGSGKLGGIISIGLTVDFGNSIIIPILAKLGKENPFINFRIRYGHASEMNDALLKGELDFAFVDSYGLDKLIKTEIIHDEELELCCSQDYIKKVGSDNFDKKFFEGLDYIDYVEDGSIVKKWLDHQHGIKNANIRLRASLMSVQGLSRMLVKNFAAGILAKHISDRLIQEGHKLYKFPGNNAPLSNKISIAYIENKSRSAAVEIICKSIIKELKG